MKWETKPLNSIADFCLGKMLDQNKNRGDLLPYLANVNVRWGQFDLTELREMRFEAGELDRYGLRAGDIVMCEGGEPGRCAVWNEQSPQMMIQKALHRIRPHQGLGSRFLFYQFLNMGRKQEFSGLFTGATIKHLPREKLAKLQVNFPSVEEQNAIVDVLSAYDDLIENNRRRIGLLEEAARLLYREWFVYFRFPGHEHVRMIDGLPEGWRRVPLCDIAFLNYGKALKAEARSDGSVPVYGSSGTVGMNNKALVAGPAIVIGRKGNVGSVFWSATSCWPIDTVYFVAKEQSSLWLYHALLTVKFLNTHAGVPGLNRDFAHSRTLFVPGDAGRLQGMFEDAVTPMFKHKQTLEEQNQRLAQARDLLLPRLMSGELAV